MKKLLFIGMMCVMGIGAFANAGSENSNNLVPIETIEKHNLSNVVLDAWNENNLFCTVTFTANVYNEVGAYVGSVTETRSVNTGGQYDCV